MAGPLSYGFPKSPITADVLPLWQHPLSRFAVDGPDDWRVSKLGSLDRGLRIENGTGRGDAVVDITGSREGDNAYQTLALPKPSMASQWFLVVLRRNWSGTGTSTLVAIPGTSKKELPTVGPGNNQRRDTPGVESDQPLALCRVTQADAVVQEIVDLRIWAAYGGVEAADKLALEFLNEPGAAVKIGSSTWRYERQANNVWDWREYVPVDPDSAPHRNGYGVVRTNPDGYCTIGYKTPFPRGTTNAIANSMDPPGGYAAFEFVKGEPHAASFRAFASDGKALGNASVGISYAAFGF